MKCKTTRKAVVNGSVNVRCCGYCDLYYLLRNHEPIAYTCGVYGWNFDVFEVYGVTICTGYRGMPGARLKGVKVFEEKARRIWEDGVEWHSLKHSPQSRTRAHKLTGNGRRLLPLFGLLLVRLLFRGWCIF